MSVYDTNQNVLGRITQVDSIVNNAMSTGEEFLSTLSDLTVLNPPYFLPNPSTFTPEHPMIDATLPESVTGDVQDIINGETGQAPNAADYPVTTPEVNLPTEDLDNIQGPSASDFTFTEAPDEYRSALLTALVAKLQQDIQGGTGLAPEVEDAIWRLDEERMNIALQRNVDNVMDEFAGRGFSLPAGVLMDAVDDVHEKDRMDRVTRGRDITIKQGELAQQNVQSAITNGINLENVLIAHFDRMKDRALTAAQAVINVGIAIMEAQLRKVLGILDAKKTELAVKLDVERFKLERYANAVAVYAKKMDAILGKARAITELYSADIEVYKAAIQKAETIARLDIENARIVLDNSHLNLQAALEAARTNLTSFMQAAQLRGNVAEAGAKVTQAYVSAALNSINSVIQLASTGTTTATES